MSYFDVFNEVQSSYKCAAYDKGFTLYQAFAYVYEDVEVFLKGKTHRVSIEAFTALFVIAIKGGLEFVKDDPFTRDVFDELGAAYSKIASLGLGEGDTEEEKFLLEHIRLVTNYIGV